MGVQGFADDAYANSRRYLDPAQGQDRRRFEQDLINKGIDPMSDMGRQMSDRMSMQHGDQNTAAAFESLGFGQGVQSQMFGQDFQNRQLAGDMMKAQWGTEGAQMEDATRRYGLDQNYDLGMDRNALDRYGMDQNFGINSGMLDLNRQKQDYAEMMGYEGLDFRDAQFNEGNDRYWNSLALSMIPGANIPGGTSPPGIDPGQQGNPWDPWADYFSNSDYWGLGE